MTRSKVVAYGLAGIKTLAGAGMNEAAIAREIGVSRATLSDTCHRHWGVALREQYSLVPVNQSGRVSPHDPIRNGVTVGEASLVLAAGGPKSLWSLIGTSRMTGERYLTRSGVKISKITTIVPADPAKHPDRRIERYLSRKRKEASEQKEVCDAS